ncbi:MAG: hypothetical protein WC529_03090 [Candidatus Margulisiibacteriota bacterium]
MDLKKAYYFIICLAALFFLFWGAVDLTGSAIGLVVNRGAAPAADQLAGQPSEQYLEAYYQKKMLVDRLWDGVARVAFAGAVFLYCRKRADGSES